MNYSDSQEPRWLTIARAELGVHETPGSKHTRRILEYLRTTRLPSRLAAADETPWCAAFVGWCIAQAGLESSHSAAARSYLEWGGPLEAPRNGCIAVLTRPGHEGSGHVGFWVGGTQHELLLLGGNQGNRVSMRLYDRDRLLGFRWPAGVP